MPKKANAYRLKVLMNGITIGHWDTAHSTGHRFTYDTEWLNNDKARPLSLSMPLRPSTESYRGPLVESYFDNLLPDSIEIKKRISAHVNAGSIRAFDLLREIGNDCVGAVQLVGEDVEPGNVQTIEGQPLSDEQIAKNLSTLTSTPIPGVHDSDILRLSIAGAQEKTGFLWHNNSWCQPSGATPTTHIFKLPMGKVGNEQADLSTSVENEWLCAQLLRSYGLNVANCSIEHFDTQTVLAVERFDRRLADKGDWWMRLPQEDMCQATGSPPEKKYESDGGPGIEHIMSLLRGSRTAKNDRRHFMQTQVLFWMLCAPDGHAKNFSVFIEPGGRYRSTPLYDVISAYPILGNGRNKIAPQRIKMAMSQLGKNRHFNWAQIHPRHFYSSAKKAQFGEPMESLIESIQAKTTHAIEEVNAKLPNDFPDAVANQIFDGLRKSSARLI